MSWFKKHKIMTVILAFILIGVIATAAGGGDSNTSTSTSTSSSEAKETRFTDRADIQDKDVEVIIGETATIDGVSVTVNSVDYKTSLGEYSDADSGKTFAVLNVTVENGSDSTESYNGFNWRVQTAAGQVLDQSFESVEPRLGSGDLVSGGKTTGTVVFEVPVEEGSQFAIWKPGYGSERAIIKLK